MLYLVSEIVLVDDASEHKHLGDQLEEYTRRLPVKVSIHRIIFYLELHRSNQIRLMGCPTSILQIQNDFTKLKIKHSFMICNWYFSLHRTTDIHYDSFVCNTHRV